MFCSQCGTAAAAGTRFCTWCGAPLEQASAEILEIERTPPAPGPALAERRVKGRRPQPRRGSRWQDPYRERIQQLRLQLRALKLDLRQLNAYLANVRTQYYMSAAFVPRGLLRWGYKAIEDFRLMQPQQQKQILQQKIFELERELLQLQQEQAAWRASQADRWEREEESGSSFQ
ncbi:MAG: zinc ribbon domain-containing protein [Thermogemmatispora sp.]|uniref:zinc ribbon domain-containing protein n=1 Tax=Thermogemmatispora sp. TaxID=1968838 RepID=UPI00260407AF|nr:zinc ribbon domain-containing protein [Thermogemmatispora sp.]MBX5457078.1 zinc ribbon domain-containing protein [Thermogemmatispora sp.]